MLEKKVLMDKAVSALASVFGRKYLQDNYETMCKAHGITNNQIFQLFLGIKDAKDLPHREANEKGWVVYGLVWLDVHTGEVLKLEYVLE